MGNLKLPHNEKQLYGIPGIKKDQLSSFQHWGHRLWFLIIAKVSWIGATKRDGFCCPWTSPASPRRTFKHDLSTSFCRYSGYVSKVSWFYITSQTRCSYAQSDHSVEAEGDGTPRAVAKHSSYQQLEEKRYHWCYCLLKQANVHLMQVWYYSQLKPGGLWGRFQSVQLSRSRALICSRIEPEVSIWTWSKFWVIE